MKVKDLIAKLQRCDPDAEIVIHDADTDWGLPDFQVRILSAGNIVSLAGDYGNGRSPDLVDYHHEVVL